MIDKFVSKKGIIGETKERPRTDQGETKEDYCVVMTILTLIGTNFALK